MCTLRASPWAIPLQAASLSSVISPHWCVCTCGKIHSHMCPLTLFPVTGLHHGTHQKLGPPAMYLSTPAWLPALVSTAPMVRPSSVYTNSWGLIAASVPQLAWSFLFAMGPTTLCVSAVGPCHCTCVHTTSTSHSFRMSWHLTPDPGGASEDPNSICNH